MDLEAAFRGAWSSEDFRDEFASLLTSYAGRPTPVNRVPPPLGADRGAGAAQAGGPDPHRVPQDQQRAGQALLARDMGKTAVIAETGAGQHGVATATAAALFGLRCKVFMGAVDVDRQALNVFRMRLLGAEVVAGAVGQRHPEGRHQRSPAGLVATVEDTHYCIGSVVGPHPYPWMVREFQRVVGDEARAQCRAILGGADPDYVVACVGGGSNAMGTFAGFLDTPARLVGVEAGGDGLESGRHGASIARGVPGVLHGARSYLPSRTSTARSSRPTSISAGLDYPGTGPEHAALAASGRATYAHATDTTAIEGFKLLAVTEGIVPALEPAHAIGWLAAEAGRGGTGRGHRPRDRCRGGRQGRPPGGRAARRAPRMNLEAHLRAPAGGRPEAPRALRHRWAGLGLARRGRAVADAGADAIEIGIPFSDR